MEDTNAGASVLETYATKVFSKRIIGSISIIILAAAVFYKSPTEIDPNDCYSQLSNGQWVNNRWYPYQCLINRYPTKSDLKNCIINPTSRHSPLFIGDPTLQQYYSAISEQLQESEAFSITENTDNKLQFTFGEEKYSVNYIFHPLIDTKLITKYKELNSLSIESRPKFIVNLFSGFEKRENPNMSCKDLISEVIKLQTSYIKNFNDAGTSPFMLIMLQGLLEQSDKECQHVMEDMYSKEVQAVMNNVVLINMNNSVNNEPLQGLEVIIHFICNSREYSTCCIPFDKTLYVSVVMPILCVILALYLGLLLVKITGTLLPLEPYFETAGIDLDRVYSIIHLVGFITISIFYVCLSEKLEFFFKSSPWRSPLLMILFIIAIICLGFLKTSKLNQVGLLCKEQVMEWRGWAVLVIISLEYSNMSETSIGMWLWQFLVCCTAFSTSYTHFIWFWTHGNFSLRRIGKVLFRQNYLVLWLCLTVHSPYTLYTIPAINTVVFLMVYIIVYIPPKLSADSLKAHENNGKQIVVMKICISFLLIVIITAAELHFSSLSTYSKSLFTIIYTSRLMVILGICIAYWTVLTKNGQTFNKGHGVLVLFGFGIYTVFLLCAERTPLFMIAHLLFITLPIVAYIIFRNWTEAVRSTYSVIFQQFGRMAIEFYVLFQHVMLTHNGRGLLYLFPGYYAINMLATLTIVIFVSYIISQQSRIVTDSFNKTSSNEDDQLPV